MKTKQKKQPVQIDLWGNLLKPKSKKLKKFAAFNAERDLVIRMLNDEKIRKENEK